MDFTDPFAGIEARKLTDAELAKAIRIDMAAELDAINLYQSHIEATDNPVAKRMIQHIMEEEKDHLEEFAQLLYMLDPQQAESAPGARHDFEAMGGTPVLICNPANASAPAPSTLPSGLTVGSLQDREH